MLVKQNAILNPETETRVFSMFLTSERRGACSPQKWSLDPSDFPAHSSLCKHYNPFACGTYPHM